MVMSKKEKKARKLIKKLNKKCRKKELEQYEANNGIDMYEPAGCGECNDGQLYSGGRNDLSITYYSRCGCANKKTKKYKKFLKERDNMTFKKARERKALFRDNNDHITEGNNEEDRSW